MAEIRIGTSGWRYPPWRGVFFPRGLVQRRELEYLAGQLNSVEINGSFYSLQRPQRYRNWFEQTPDDFVFSVKGSRFITHMKRLRDVRQPLSNFFASGVLALGHKLGPFLWQLPPTLVFDPGLLREFFSPLPRTTADAAKLADEHDERVADYALTTADTDRPLRHALEVRHASFDTAECFELLRANDIALVVADAAAAWPQLEVPTSGFMYVRMHGAEELYASGYGEPVLREWADKVRRWTAGDPPLDVFVYFDNDIKAHAPEDARTLAAMLTRCG